MKLETFVDYDVWAIAVGVIRFGPRTIGIGIHIGPVIIQVIFGQPRTPQVYHGAA